MEKGYNGWTNYQTWAANLWLTSEEWVERAKEVDLYDLAAEIKEAVTEDAMYILTEANLISDLLGHAIDSINYYELAEGFKEE